MHYVWDWVALQTLKLATIVEKRSSTTIVQIFHHFSTVELEDPLNDFLEQSKRRCQLRSVRPDSDKNVSLWRIYRSLTPLMHFPAVGANNCSMLHICPRFRPEIEPALTNNGGHSRGGRGALSGSNWELSRLWVEMGQAVRRLPRFPRPEHVASSPLVQLPGPRGNETGELRQPVLTCCLPLLMTLLRDQLKRLSSRYMYWNERSSAVDRHLKH